MELLSLEEIERLQWSRLIDILHYAHENVPYYQELFDYAGVRISEIKTPEDVYRVPITTKEAIQQNFPDRITVRNSNPSQWRYVATRGTANRLIVIQDFKKRDIGCGAVAVVAVVGRLSSWPTVFRDSSRCL